MKKLIVGLLAAFLMTTGLVAFSSSPASAACPYQGCLQTSTKATAKYKSGTVTLKAVVTADGSNVTPQGQIVLTVNKITKTKRGRKVFREVYQSETTLGSDGKVVLKLGKSVFGKGKFKFGAQFTDNQDAGFGYSIGFDKFKIGKK